MKHVIDPWLPGALGLSRLSRGGLAGQGAGSANFRSGRCLPSATRCTGQDGASTTPTLLTVVCAPRSVEGRRRSVPGGGARMWERALGPPEESRAEGGGLKRAAMCRVQRVEPAQGLDLVESVGHCPHREAEPECCRGRDATTVEVPRQNLHEWAGAAPRLAERVENGVDEVHQRRLIVREHSVRHKVSSATWWVRVRSSRKGSARSTSSLRCASPRSRSSTSSRRTVSSRRNSSRPAWHGRPRATPPRRPLPATPSLPPLGPPSVAPRITAGSSAHARRAADR
jgi:hypothetical protein